jgi:hypothetical protein
VAARRCDGDAGGPTDVGFRQDVLDFGPVAERPIRRDFAWHSLETNEVGIDEFMRWDRKAGVEVRYAVNLCTRGVQEALGPHEYVHHADGTQLSELRVANGAKGAVRHRDVLPRQRDGRALADRAQDAT